MNQGAAVSPPGKIPDKLGKYDVLGVAGSGNMGVVYTGYDPYADRDVAIKVCAPRTEDAGARSLAHKLFYNEAQLAGVLDHPNILKILDAGEQAGQQYLIMEYVDGAYTLRRYCDVSRLLPVKEVAEIAYTCAKALDYAHRHGVVHRDIKPSNIMFTRDGVLKIGDFGIAQRTVAETTQFQGLIGSPQYMSPEQVREERLNGQTDIYSLGVVVYELLSGRAPFTAPKLSSLIHRITSEPPVAVNELRPDVPEALAGIVAWAMEKDVAKRYLRGRDMASDLAAVFTELEPPRGDLADDRKFEMLGRIGFFRDFSEREMWEALRASTWHAYESAQAIVTEGAVDLSFFVVVKGEATVAQGGRVFTQLSQGDCFGEMGYLRQGRHSTTVVAADDVVVMKIDASLLDRASKDCQIRFHKAFARTLVERLSRTSADRSPAGVGPSSGREGGYPADAREARG